MSSLPPDVPGAPSSRPAPAIRLSLHGVQGWVGRERVSGDIASIVVLRPIGLEDRLPPAASMAKLAEVMDAAAQLKPAAVEAIHEARKTFLRPAYDRTRWSLVEVRIDRSGRAWLGLYESAGDQQTHLVEFDEAWSPCSVWLKGIPDRSNIGDQGQRIG